MSFLLNIWRRIGAKLYLALGFAVLLTLVSSALGVYYFEQSGDASYRVRTESVPVLEASWAAVREGERLGSLEAEASTGVIAEEQVGEALESLEDHLRVAAIVSSLTGLGTQAQDLAYDLAEVIDRLVVIQRGKQDSDISAGV